MKRIGLLDPMLKYSEYVGGAPEIKLLDSLKGKFNGWYFLFNILLPIIIFIVILYMCKVMMKKMKSGIRKNRDESGSDINIPIEYTLPF